MVRTALTAGGGPLPSEDTPNTRQARAEADRDLAQSLAKEYRLAAEKSAAELAEAKRVIEEHDAALQSQRTEMSALQRQLAGLADQVNGTENSRRARAAADAAAAEDDHSPAPPVPHAAATAPSVPTLLTASEAGRCFLHIGISIDCATALVSREGMRDWRSLKDLDDKRIKTLCYNLRRGGGAAPGIEVPEFAEFRLSQLVYHVQKLIDCSPDATLDRILPEHLDLLTPQRELEKAYDASSVTVPVFSNAEFTNKPDRAIETLDRYLMALRSTTGTPLAYVVRERMIPYDSAGDDPSKYCSKDEELAARMPIVSVRYNGDISPKALEKLKPTSLTPVFVQDRRIVARILYDLLSKLNIYVHMTQSVNKQDGRAAYLDLRNGMFSSKSLTLRNVALEKTIDALEYRGEVKNFDWRRYTDKHIDCHNIKAAIASHDGFVDWTEDEKVRKLWAGIKCADIDTCVTHMLTVPALAEDFRACVLFVTDFIATSKSRRGTQRNISELGRGGRGGGGGRGGRNGGGRAGRGQGTGRGGHGGRTQAREGGRPPQPEVDKCTHITESWYAAGKYGSFGPAERQKVYQNLCRKKLREQNLPLPEGVPALPFEQRQTSQIAQFRLGGPLPPTLPPPPPDAMNMPLTAIHLDHALHAFGTVVNKELQALKDTMDNDDVDLFEEMPNIDTLAAIGRNRKNVALGRQPPDSGRRKKAKFS